MRLPNSLAECSAAKSPTSPCRSRSGRRWWPAPRREGRRVMTRGPSIRRPIGLRAGRAPSSWCSTCGRSPSTIPTEYSPEPTNSLKRSEGSRRLQSRLLSPSIATPLCDVRPVAGIPDDAGLGLHRVLWQHNIPLPALPVLAVFDATDDWLQGLPAWIGARRSGIRIADIDCLGQPWSRPPDKEFLCVLPPLGCRSGHGAVSARRADNGWAVLVAGKAKDRPVGACAVIVAM